MPDRADETVNKPRDIKLPVVSYMHEEVPSSFED